MILYHLNLIFDKTLKSLLNFILNKQNLTDAHTCYKVFDAKLFKKIKLQENDFSFCPEITTKVSNLKAVFGNIDNAEIRSCTNENELLNIEGFKIKLLF